MNLLMRKRLKLKLDYQFTKQILLTMENYESHKISLNDLRKELLLDADVASYDKLEGHIKLLEDNKYVEFEIKEYKPNETFMKAWSSKTCRITSQGYEFLDILKNDTVLNKIKNFALPMAFEFGKQLILQYVKEQVGISD